MEKTIFRIVFIVFVALPFQHLYAQSGVGIGTSNPNPNAALDIQSATNDKGILIPRLTSSERLAMIGSLSANENGLLVFDSDLKAFYFWNGSIWTSMSVLQDLQLIGNILSITNNGSATNIDLSPFSGTNTDNQNLGSSSSGNNRTVTISGGSPTTFNVADNDNNAGNELQTISKSGATVTLSKSGGAFSINDGDSNPANELQNLSSTSSGTNRTIAINGGTNATINVADNDNNSSNELQTISKSGATVTLSKSGGAFNINDGDSSPTNELQNLSSTASGTNRTIAINGGTNATISIADNDNSTSNELQSLSIAGSTLSISSGNSVGLPAPGITAEGFKAYVGSALNFTPGLASIIFNTEVYDINGSYDAAKGAYIPPITGVYHFTGLVNIFESNLAPIQIMIYVNSKPTHHKIIFPSNMSDGQNVSYDIGAELSLNKGDIVQFFIDISGVKTFTVNPGKNLSYFAGRLVIE